MRRWLYQLVLINALLFYVGFPSRICHILELLPGPKIWGKAWLQVPTSVVQEIASNSEPQVRLRVWLEQVETKGKKPTQTLVQIVTKEKQLITNEIITKVNKSIILHFQFLFTSFITKKCLVILLLLFLNYFFFFRTKEVKLTHTDKKSLATKIFCFLSERVDLFWCIIKFIIKLLIVLLLELLTVEEEGINGEINLRVRC